MTIQITPELISAAKEKLNIGQYYEPSDTAIAKHKAYEEFVEKRDFPNLPKLVYYIIMDELFPTGLDGNDLGYKVKLKESQPRVY